MYKIKKYKNESLNLEVTFRIGTVYISSSARNIDDGEYIGSDTWHKTKEEMDDIIKMLDLKEVKDV